MQEESQGFCSILSYDFLRKMRQGILDLLKVAIRFFQSMSNAIKLAQYTHLHLFCCLVGKGYCENSAISHRILYHESHIFFGEGEGLA